jgi:hypothetical protein
MLNNYFDEYDKIIEILEPLNKDQCCKITKDLLIKINQEIINLNASEIFNHLTNFITRALLKEESAIQESLNGSELEQKTVDFVKLYTANNYSSADAALEVAPEAPEAEAAPKASEDEEATVDVVPAASEADEVIVDDVKKKCVALGSTKNRFIKPELSSKIVELVTKKYPKIDREKLELVLTAKGTSHQLLCSILKLPADSEASLKEATLNEAELNKVFTLPKLGGNIDYNKECQIM